MIDINESVIEINDLMIEINISLVQMNKSMIKKNKSMIEINSSRSEATDRVVFGLITWFAGPVNRAESLYIYIYFQGVPSRSRDISTSLSRTSSTKF